MGYKDQLKEVRNAITKQEYQAEKLQDKLEVLVDDVATCKLDLLNAEVVSTADHGRDTKMDLVWKCGSSTTKLRIMAWKLPFNILIQLKHQRLRKNNMPNALFLTMASQTKLVGMIPIQSQLKQRNTIPSVNTRLKPIGNISLSMLRINTNAIRLPIFTTNSCFIDANPSIIFLF